MTQGRNSGGGKALGQMTTRLVQLHNRYHGRGPANAKSFLVPDAVICILRGGFTSAEQTLIEHGDADLICAVRRSVQRAMGDEFIPVVEQATDRRVIAYMSQVHAPLELTVEIFILEPAEDDPDEGGSPD